MGVGRKENKVRMKVSLKLLMDIGLDNDCCKGSEWDLAADGTWW